MTEPVAIGFAGQRITAFDIDLAQRAHYWGRDHNCAWEDCQDDACFDDLVRLGMALEADRPSRPAEPESDGASQPSTSVSGHDVSRSTGADPPPGVGPDQDRSCHTLGG